MVIDVAAFLGETGQTVSIYETGQAAIYTKVEGNWKVTKVLALSLSKSLGLNGLRQKMAELICFLDNCKVFVASNITGVPYYELEKVGCSIWEIEGKPDSFLDCVVEKEEDDRMQAKEDHNLKPAAPVETANGCYFISLKEIQSNNSGFTSKQILLPFLSKGAFYNLEVVCSHVPPWLEAELAAGNLSGNIERVSKDEVRIVIAKKTCNC